MRATPAVTAAASAACLLLASCGPPAPQPSPTATGSASPSPTPRSGTGVYGSVTAGPTYPVERADQPCPPQPVSAGVVARSLRGAPMASTHSDSSGRYALDLLPGRYVLVVVTRSGWPACPDTPVTVEPASAVRADVSCDTGIR
ncbi:carboxypeptidase-like regulatory domain-containing protein [Sinomonas halotolerans]|uniref:Carboxypeptidase-like regulatory domain-containing protein n=1 Tax=Sinomonas halotolerans TaxID=1644133 RepID=A0ABU9X0L4_9MICC